MGRTDDQTFNDDELRKMEGHRGFPEFRDHMLSKHMMLDKIHEMWECLMRGFLDQRVIQREAETKAEQLRGLLPSGEAVVEAEIRKSVAPYFGNPDFVLFPQIEAVFFGQMEILQGEDKIDLAKNLLRCINKEYIYFVRGVQNYLSIEPSPKLALWSGGKALSDYAFGKQYMPLEQTAVGAVLDTLPLHYEWSRQAPLWNLLSQAFVAQKKYTEAHVFFRTTAAESVLLRQEVPLARAMRGLSCPIFWHPVINLPHGFAEAGKGELLPGTWRGFGSMTEALKSYVDSYKRYPDFNQESRRHMHIMGLRFDTQSLAPFASDGAMDWKAVSQYEAHIMGV